MGRPLNPTAIFKNAKSFAKSVGAKKPLFQRPERNPDAPQPQPAPPILKNEGNYGEMRFSFKDLPEEARPKKKCVLLALNDHLIHKSIFGMFEYYSGKKGHEMGRAKA
jgi:hypothetical protein